MLTNHNFNINLTEKEESIVNLLVNCAKWIEKNPQEVDNLRLKDENDEWIGKLRGNEPLELRIAGGWVRDKLLGASSDDIDISIYPDPITGYKFAKLLETYLGIEGKPELMGTLTTIEAKPDQSKHLETATAIVEDLSIDFVQQRGNETYAVDSRIPIASFGTPLDDALRRDLTINALFYNLQSRSIEDETGKGLQDLGLVQDIEPCIRTPLPPFETFRDDPLRVIRAVRFAARFGFRIDQELVDAVGREEIRNALKDGKKIARDRVGVELGKMLMGRNSYRAMQTIHHLNLHELIFLYNPEEAFKSPDLAPNPNHPAIVDISLSLIASTIVSRLLAPLSSTSENPSLYQYLHPLLQFKITDSPTLEDLSEISPEIVKRFYLSSALLPIYEFSVLDKKKRPMWLGEKIVMEGLKFKTSDKEWAHKARDSCDKLSEAVKKYGVHEAETSENVCAIGLLLREKSVHDVVLPDICGTRWNTSLFWSLARDLCRSTGESELDVINRYNIFVDRVIAAKLETRAFAFALLNGNEILDVIDELLGREPFDSLDLSGSTTLDPSKPPAKRKSSQAVSEIGLHIVRWQMQYPEATKDDCRAWLKGSERQRVLDWVEEHAPKKVEKGKNKKVKQ